jgi:hypothetical protein
MYIILCEADDHTESHKRNRLTEALDIIERMRNNPLIKYTSYEIFELGRAINWHDLLRQYTEMRTNASWNHENALRVLAEQQEEEEEIE